MSDGISEQRPADLILTGGMLAVSRQAVTSQNTTNGTIFTGAVVDENRVILGDAQARLLRRTSNELDLQRRSLFTIFRRRRSRTRSEIVGRR